MYCFKDSIQKQNFEKGDIILGIIKTNNDYIDLINSESIYKNEKELEDVIRDELEKTKQNNIDIELAILRRNKIDDKVKKSKSMSDYLSDTKKIFTGLTSDKKYNDIKNEKEIIETNTPELYKILDELEKNILYFTIMLDGEFNGNNQLEFFDENIKKNKFLEKIKKKKEELKKFKVNKKLPTHLDKNLQLDKFINLCDKLTVNNITKNKINMIKVYEIEKKTIEKRKEYYNSIIEMYKGKETEKIDYLEKMLTEVYPDEFMDNETCMKMLIELIDFNKKYTKKKIFTHKVDKNNIDKLELSTENFNEHGVKLVKFSDEKMNKKDNYLDIGDIIIKVNGIKIYTKDEIEKIIKDANTKKTDIDLEYIKGVNYTDYNAEYNMYQNRFQNNITIIDDVYIHNLIKEARKNINEIYIKKKEISKKISNIKSIEKNK